MDFTKMHGCGNDYVYVDVHRVRIPDPARLAAEISDRHTGVGSDGLILIAPSRKADFRMIMFNQDGSEGSMCGNGVRCVGKYVYDRGLTRDRSIRVETKSGVVGLELHVRGGKVREVTVDMGPARPVPASFHVRADGVRTLLREKVLGVDGLVASMGNPHCVVVVESVEQAPVTTKGPLIERHPDFPSRVNVEFVEILSRRRVRQRTWERGSGETHACGSGACAVGFALSSAGLVQRRVRVDLTGGSLEIEHADDGRIFMTGPAVEVFQGRYPTKPARRR
jgi:diaminopimelate epimerase